MPSPAPGIARGTAMVAVHPPTPAQGPKLAEEVAAQQVQRPVHHGVDVHDVEREPRLSGEPFQPPAQVALAPPPREG
eukprot:4650250-Lingulodinium_polyedra.AAC.1